MPLRNGSLLVSSWLLGAAACALGGPDDHTPANPQPGPGSGGSSSPSGSGGGSGDGGASADGGQGGASLDGGGPVGAGGSGGSVEVPPARCVFAEQAQSFALPPGFGPDALDDLREDSGGGCVESELSYEAIDLDGDLRPDLVVADRCDFAGVGTTAWRVYLGAAEGFAQDPIAWALPPGFATDQLDDLRADEGGVCATGELSYDTIDMDGDLRPDLVVTDRCDTAEVGTTRWLVYLNEGDGFASTPIQWSLPGGYATDQLDDIAKDSGGTCAVGELSYALFDLGGDLMPDLVVADRCDHEGVGSTHWLVYDNLGDGFSAVAQVWALPQGFGTDAFDDFAMHDGGFCAVGRFGYALADMDGDLRPELVVTDDCDHGGVGTTEWLVFENAGDGFAPSSASWPLPSGFGLDQLSFVEGDDGGTCVESELSFALVEADGDTRPDLVVADHCDFEGAGTTHWSLYSNTGAGFAAEAAFLLPGTSSGFGFDDLDDLDEDTGGVCAVGELSYAALDWDGDRVLDLVVTDACDFEDVGTTHWRIHPGACD